MSFGSDLLSLAPSAVVSGAGSLFGSALGQIGSAIAAKRQYKYNTKLMQQQHAYELENMSELERIQRGLALDSSLLRRQSLEKAGYNAADPEGTGTTAPSMSAPSTSASGSISWNPRYRISDPSLQTLNETRNMHVHAHAHKCARTRTRTFYTSIYRSHSQTSFMDRVWRQAFVRLTSRTDIYIGKPLTALAANEPNEGCQLRAVIKIRDTKPVAIFVSSLLKSRLLMIVPITDL